MEKPVDEVPPWHPYDGCYGCRRAENIMKQAVKIAESDSAFGPVVQKSGSRRVVGGSEGARAVGEGDSPNNTRGMLMPSRSRIPVLKIGLYEPDLPPIKFDPVCKRCSEYFSDHIVAHDSLEIPRHKQLGVFDNVDTIGKYCPTSLRDHSR